MSGRLVVSSLIVAVCAAVAGGFVALGSPATARERRLDEKRGNDLAAISRAVDSYVAQNGRLPGALADLEQLQMTVLDLRDSSNGQPYEYAARTSDTYELCAVFTRPSAAGSQFRRHGVGRQCFVLKSKKVNTP